MKDKISLKELYAEEFNKDENHRAVLEKADIQKANKMKISKIALMPLCLAAVALVAVMAAGNQQVPVAENETSKVFADVENDTLYINAVNNAESSRFRIDAEIREVSNYFCIPYYRAVSDLSIPEDFDKKDNVYAMFVKSDRSKNEYDNLLCYEKWLENSSNGRAIIIQYSEKGEPPRDYYFENGKSSSINDFSLEIYEYENSFFTQFYYDNLYIDIETHGITKEELTALLKSIIK